MTGEDGNPGQRPDDDREPDAPAACPRGCPSVDPDDCRASVAIPCPIGNWTEPEPYHVTAGICRDCRIDLDQCVCGEE